MSIEEQDLVWMMERPKLRRSCRKRCIICEKENVSFSWFLKCPNCNSGQDANRSWTEFKTNADYKPAHVSTDAIIYGHNRVCTRQLLPMDFTSIG